MMTIASFFIGVALFGAICAVCYSMGVLHGSQLHHDARSGQRPKPVAFRKREPLAVKEGGPTGEAKQDFNRLSE